ncbi:MAG: DUF7674 family protein [bacterium]
MNVNTPDEAFQLLLDSCPAFRPHWEETRTSFFFGEPPDSVGPYFDVAWITALLVDLVRRQGTECFPAVFALLEQLLVNGSDYVKNWVVVGVLETLQNQVSHTELTYAAFEPWLGSKTRQEWDGLIEAWGG